MRRLVTLALLYLGMRLILPLGSEGQGSQALLSFGFLILAAHTVGEMAGLAGLPRIVGYLAAGIVFGPHVLGTVSHAGAERLTPVSDLAVALIAFLAGAELRWSEVRQRGTLLLKVMSAEVGLTFVALTAAFAAASRWIPALEGASAAEVLALGAVFASVAVVHSPAVTLAILSETGARGPVARTALGVVLLADIAVVLLFTAVVAAARSVVESEGGGAGAPGLGLLAWEILGAVVIGSLLGLAVASYLRWVGRELVLFAVLMAFFGLEVARMAHVELLLTLLTAGFIAENASTHGDELREAMERSAAPIFVVFFALSGAKIDLAGVAPLLPLVVPLALVRAGAIRAGTRVGLLWAGPTEPSGSRVWTGLVSQAGVAIGLSAIVADAYPERGPFLAGLLLALIAVNETAGPILFRRGLKAAGEFDSTVPSSRRSGHHGH